MQKYNSEVQIPANTKEFFYSVEAAVKIMSYHALVAGFLVAIAIAAIGLVWGWLRWPEWAVTLGVLVMLVVFFIEWQAWRRDARPDKPIITDSGESGRVVVRVRFQHIKDDGHVEIKKYDLPGTREALKTLATAYVNGLETGIPVKFTERAWAGYNKPFSPNEWRDLVQVGIKQEFFEWRNPRNERLGWTITKKGDALLKELADNDMDEFIDD